MPLPRISIITPCLNAAATVEQTLRSVVDQQYPALEYIVIDGGSTDGTQAIIERYRDRLAALVCEKDRGISDAFNKGIDRATGDIIGILNADDFHEPDTLATVAARWDGDRPMTIIHGDMNIVYDSGVRRHRPRRWRGAIYFDLPVFHPTCFVGRRVYEAVGRFDLQYQCAMDYDLVVRAWQAGVEFAYVPRVLANFRWGGVASRRALHTHREVFRSQRSHGMAWLPCAAALAAKATVNRAKALARAVLTAERPNPPVGELQQAPPGASRQTPLIANDPAVESSTGDAGPLLSIIIPCYNAAATLPGTLASLDRIAPAHRPLVEVILVNDASTDGTGAVMDAFVAEHRLPAHAILSPVNRGPSHARNVANRAARGEWIMYLDGDDELRIDPVPILRADPSCTAHSFVTVQVKGGRVVGRRRAPRLDLASHMDVLTAYNIGNPSSVVFRRDAIRRPWDDEYRCVEDWYFWMANPTLFERLRVHEKTVLAHIHIHGANASANYAKMGRYREIVSRRVLAEHGPALTAKQRHNLLVQAEIGRLLQRQRPNVAALLRMPVSISLYAKLWVYVLLGGWWAKVDPYGR